MYKINIFITIFIFFPNFVNATPTPEDGLFDDEYYGKYLEVGELIYELNKVDIKNADFYEGYIFKDEDNCKFQVKLKPYDSDIKIFEVDICKETSRILNKVKK